MKESDADFQIKGCGAVIKEWRETAGKTIQEFADLGGCDRGRISKIENNQLGISLSMVETIAKGLGKRSEEIVLKCLETVYPEMRKTKVGNKIVKYLSNDKK